MRLISILVTTLFIVLLVGSLISEENQQDVDKIKRTIQSAYVEGLQNEGDLKKIDKGFHPDFNLLGIDEKGSMWKLPIKEWKEKTVKKVKEGKLPRTGEEIVSIKFLSVDVAGTAAVAKIEFYVGKDLKYIDYLSLYKFDKEWKIVNKIFYKVKE